MVDKGEKRGSLSLSILCARKRPYKGAELYVKCTAVSCLIILSFNDHGLVQNWVIGESFYINNGDGMEASEEEQRRKEGRKEGQIRV